MHRGKNEQNEKHKTCNERNFSTGFLLKTLIPHLSQMSERLQSTDLNRIQKSQPSSSLSSVSSQHILLVLVSYL